MSKKYLFLQKNSTQYFQHILRNVHVDSSHYGGKLIFKKNVTL